MKIRTSSLIGVTAYHGTLLRRYDAHFFKKLSFMDADYPAVWVTVEEFIAEVYSHRRSVDEKNELQIVYRVVVNAEDIADLTTPQAKEIMSILDADDLSECIPELRRSFDGWSVPGSIGGHNYEDIALFREKFVRIQDVKLLVDGEWTGYMSLKEAIVKAAQLGFKPRH